MTTQPPLIDRSRPPETPDLPVFKLPPVIQTRLANGLEAVLVEDDRLPLIHLRLGFPAGSKYDPAGLWGLSETTAALLTQGTTERDARQMAERVAELGGSLRAWSGPDALVLEGSVLAENFEAFLELAAEAARRATFPDQEVALRKQNRKQELLAQRALADYLAEEKLAAVVFGAHPYAHQEPTPESIDRLDRSALLAFRDRHLSPARAVLVLVGALPAPERTLRMVEASLADWAAGPAPDPPAAHFPEPRRTLTLMDRPGSVQADLRIGRLAVTREHPDYFPLLVANTVLGGGASSRLFSEIREKRGYAYDAHSALNAMKDGAVLQVVTQIRNEVAGEALQAVLEQMRRIAAEPVSPEELDATRNYLSGVFVIRLETQQGLAGQLAVTRLLDLPLEYLEQYTLRVRAAEPEQVQAAAARYLDPEQAAIVVVGDAARLHGPLKKLGEVRLEKAP
jgi:zinc protease